MVSINPFTHKYTYAEFLEMEIPEGDTSIYELINGEIVKRASPNAPHQSTSFKLSGIFFVYNQEKMADHRYHLAAFAEDKGKVTSSVLPGFELEVSEIFD